MANPVKNEGPKQQYPVRQLLAIRDQHPNDEEKENMIQVIKKVMRERPLQQQEAKPAKRPGRRFAIVQNRDDRLPHIGGNNRANPDRQLREENKGERINGNIVPDQNGPRQGVRGHARRRLELNVPPRVRPLPMIPENAPIKRTLKMEETPAAKRLKS